MRTGDLSAGNLQNSFLTGFQILPSVPPYSVVPDVPLFRDHIDRFNKLFALYIKMKGTNMYSNISCEKMVVDAAKVPSSSKDLFVVESTSIKRFDMDNANGIKTGLEKVDAALDKFYCGSLNLITGIPGSGKTSFISILAAQAVEQGFPVLIYSGELAIPMLNNWILSVQAGQANMAQQTRNNRVSYIIKEEAIAQINDFYKRKLFFYDMPQGATWETLLATIENSVKRYGIKCCFIDSLTTVRINQGAERKKEEKEFIVQCKKLAQKMDIILFLSIHPNKMDRVRPVEIIDIGSNAGYTSPADRIISLYRVRDEDREINFSKRNCDPVNCDVQLRILKDRFGSAAGAVVPLFFDSVSRRFFDNPKTLAFRYLWDHEKHPNSLPFFDISRYRELVNLGYS